MKESIRGRVPELVETLEGAIFTPDEGLLLQSILQEVIHNAEKFGRPHIGALASGLLHRIARAVHDPASVPEEKKH